MLDAAVEDESRAEVVRRTSGGFDIPMEAILAAGGTIEAAPPGDDAPPSVTAPMTVHDVPTRPVSELERRVDAALAAETDEISAPPRLSTLPGYTGESHRAPAPPRPRTMPPPPPPTSGRRRAARESELPIGEDDILDLENAVDELALGGPPALEVEDPPISGSLDVPLLPGEESGSHELPPGLEAPVVSSTAGSFDDDAPRVAAGAPEDDAASQWPAQSTDELRKEDEWDPPSMPPREPTMILSQPSAAVPSAIEAGLDVTERRPDERWASASALPPMADDPAGHDGVDEPKAPPSGGEFARELRKKMSMMAQRLFRGTDVPAAPPVDVRPPHEFRTEIDLAEIEAADAGAAASDVYDLSSHATFAGDDHGLPTNPGLEAAPPTTGTGSSRTSESGEITRGTSDAASLIARMFTSEFTGKVTFRRPGAEKVIFFDAGRPVFASSNLSEDRMGELLYREGKITLEQFAGCRDIVLESGRRMGEILVDRGYLKRRELLPAVRRHVEDIIYSLFAWDAGEYRIVPGDGAAGERIRLSRHPAAMVLEGVRRKLGLTTLERLLGPTTTVVEVADRDKAGTVVAVADLQPDERAALAAMDGSADIGHIARATGAVLVTVYHLAWAMVLLGVGTVRRRGHDEDDAPALVGETDLAIDRERVRARHRLVAEADYFALLGVRRDATGFEIRRAFEGSRRDFDAESFPPELRAELGLELAEVSAVLDEAYRVLRDDRLRAAYLANLAE
jgi:hypothetical protein